MEKKVAQLVALIKAWKLKEAKEIIKKDPRLMI